MSVDSGWIRSGYGSETETRQAPGTDDAYSDRTVLVLERYRVTDNNQLNDDNGAKAATLSAFVLGEAVTFNPISGSCWKCISHLREDSAPGNPAFVVKQRWESRGAWSGAYLLPETVGG